MNPFGRLLSVIAIASFLLVQNAFAQGEHPASGQTQTSVSVTGETPKDSSWHLDLSPYLWFAGAHGTVGALGRNVSMHASAGDLLSHANFGLMGAAEARKKRFLLNGDLLWIRLSDSRALPFSGLGAVSADVRVGQLVWTSKLGYRLIDRDKIKVAANVGVRFWNLGQKFNFTPSPLGRSLNGDQSWADILVGGRVELPVGKKVAINLAGDVGGWESTAKLDYQFAAILGYNVSPKWTLQAGYRYLFVDYRGSDSSIYNVVTSGAVIGATYHFK